MWGPDIDSDRNSCSLLGLYFCLDQVKLLQAAGSLSGSHSRSDVAVMHGSWLQPLLGAPGIPGSREDPQGIRPKHTVGSLNNVCLEMASKEPHWFANQRSCLQLSLMSWIRATWFYRKDHSEPKAMLD